MYSTRERLVRQITKMRLEQLEQWQGQPFLLPHFPQRRSLGVPFSRPLSQTKRWYQIGNELLIPAASDFRVSWGGRQGNRLRKKNGVKRRAKQTQIGKANVVETCLVDLVGSQWDTSISRYSDLPWLSTRQRLTPLAEQWLCGNLEMTSRRHPMAELVAIQPTQCYWVVSNGALWLMCVGLTGMLCLLNGAFSVGRYTLFYIYYTQISLIIHAVGTSRQAKTT